MLGDFLRAGSNFVNGLGGGGTPGASRQTSGFYPDTIGQYTQMRLASVHGRPARPVELYALLRAYYANNDLFSNLGRALSQQAIPSAALRGIRNPAYRVCEFYVAALWPGALPDAIPIVTDNERIVDPIHQIWTWSNWGNQKQVFARLFPMLGDMFIKVCQTPKRDRIYFQLVDPAHVLEFDTDERGYLTYCRIDVPISRRQGDLTRALTHTEVWSRDEGTRRLWEHDQGDRPIEELGAPLDTTPLAAFGIDFVPIVHAQFKDVGEARGVGAFTLQLDKINEAARKATRLGQILFRSAGGVWAIESAAKDASGRPLPPLKIGENGQVAGAGTVAMGDEAMLSLPGGYTISSLVPNIDYTAMLAALEADLLELQQDLPEMAFARIPEQNRGEHSGRALRMLLAPAIARANEARGNAFDALARADQMALTIGIAAGLFDAGLGKYEAGDFVHTFEGKDVIAPDELETAQSEVQQATAGKLRLDLGVSKRQVMRELGYEDTLIDEMKTETEADQTALNDAMGALLDRQPGATVNVNGAAPAGGNAPRVPPG